MSSAVTPVAQTHREQLAIPVATEAHEIGAKVEKLVEDVPLGTSKQDPETSPALEAAVVEKPSEKMTAVVEKYSNFPIASPQSESAVSEAPLQDPTVQTVTGDVRGVVEIIVTSPQVTSLTITDCPHLTGFSLQGDLGLIETLTLEHLPCLSSSSLSEIANALLGGKTPALKRLTITNCPLLDDKSCEDLAEMIKRGLVYLDMEDLPLITSVGINYIQDKIWNNLGNFAIQSILMKDPRIQWSEYPSKGDGMLRADDAWFSARYLALKETVAANVNNMPRWKQWPATN